MHKAVVKEIIRKKGILINENVKLLVYGLIPYQSLQFLKSNMSFVAGYETSISIRDKDGNQLDRKTFQSNVKVGDYISTVDRSSREVVMAEFLVKDQEYTIVGELIDQDTRIKGVVKKEIDLNGLLEEVCIYPPFIIGEYPGVWGFEENEIPVTTRDINHKIKEFPLFLSGKVNPGEFTVSIIAKDANDEIFWNKELELSSDSNIFSERIIIDKKPEENLSMEVSVSLKQNKITDLKKMSLRIRKPGLSFFLKKSSANLKTIKNEIITQICKPNGGGTQIAKALGISRQAIYQWKEIPPKHLVALEKITGVPRAEMRRDLYE